MSGAAGDGVEVDETEDANELRTREEDSKEAVPMVESNRAGLGEVATKKPVNGMNGI